MAPSMGVYGYKPKVIYSFGFPRAIAAGGVEMDLPGQKGYNATLNGNREQLIGFRLHNGLLSSALEHAIPEQMFVTPEEPGEGISAVKALSKAAQQGQRIYHITQANAATVLPNIHIDAAAMSEITAALNAGKEVTTHTDAISVLGWSGAGYIIFDPVTGDGAYKISGGANGGFLTVFMGILVLSLLGMFAGLALLFLVHTLIAIALGVLLVASSALTMFWVGEELGYGIVFAGLSLMAAMLSAIVSAPVIAWVAAAEIILALVVWILNVIYTTLKYVGLRSRSEVQIA